MEQAPQEGRIMTGKIVKSSLYSYPSCVHLRQYGLSSNVIWHRLQYLADIETNVKGLQYIRILSVIGLYITLFTWYVTVYCRSFFSTLKLNIANQIYLKFS